MGLVSGTKYSNAASEKDETVKSISLPNIRKIYIGIDPGMTTGLAIYENGKLTQLFSGGHSEMILKIYELAHLKNCILKVILEDVHADETNFSASKFIRTMMNNKELQKRIPSNIRRHEYAIKAACKRSRDSGMVAGLSADWKMFMNMMGISYYTLAPSQRQSVETITKKTGVPFSNFKNLIAIIREMKAPVKMNKEQFNELTGWTGVSNEHNRDAGSLVWWFVKNQNRIEQS